MTILKKICVYRNLDKYFYLCFHTLKGDISFTLTNRLENFIFSGVSSGRGAPNLYEVFKIYVSPQLSISFGSVTDVLVSDYAQMLRVIVKSVEESFSLYSQASMSYAYTLNSLTNIVVSDSLLKQVIKILSSSENVVVSDLLTHTKRKTVSFAEAFNVSSVSEIVLRGGIEIREAVFIASEAQITYPLVLEAHEIVTVNDVLSKKLVKTLSEVVRIASSASLRERFNASLSIRPSDSLSYIKGRYLTASLTVSVSDFVSKKLVKTLSEAVRVDSSAYISISEPPRGAL